MQDQVYLTTEEAAEYLRIKPRKLYELVAEGAVPCTKAAGKWLFPRAALDRWLSTGLVLPLGFIPADPPPIIGGSHDPLLEWAARSSGSGLALLPEGSEAGLERLANNTVAIAAIHLHRTASDEDDSANITAVRASPGLHDAVVIAFARREQGLMIAPDNPLGITDLADALARGARFGLRQKGAGAQLLLQARVSALGIDVAQLRQGAMPYATGQDLALGIRGNDIDCGLATRAVAAAHGLAFLPLVWERFDLVLRRRTYFQQGVQTLLAVMRGAEFARKATAFGGYDIGVAGTVRYNA